MSNPEIVTASGTQHTGRRQAKQKAQHKTMGPTIKPGVTPGDFIFPLMTRCTRYNVMG